MEAKLDTGIARDDAALERIGKKPVLNRTLGFMGSLGLSCTVLITWEATAFVFLSGLTNGGPSGVIYGYLLVWAGMLSLGATLGELVSMIPTSGGQYHWVSILATPKHQKFLGYITGWLTITGWQATLASAGLLTGTIIQNLVLLNHPSYAIKNWHGTLILWGVLAISYLVNTLLPTLFVKFERYAFIIHLAGFIAVIVPLLALGKKSPPGDVWNQFLNEGGWQTQGLSFCIGITGIAFGFAGIDAAVHLSEETRNAAVVIPWALVTTLLLNGILGSAMVITLLYCMGNLDEALAENSHYPFMVIFRNAVGSTAGAIAMSSIIIFMLFVATTGVLTSTSRLFWALSCDRAIPGSSLLEKRSQRTNLPRNAALTATLIAGILALINIGDANAFNGVISISVAGLNGSYLIVAVLLLYRRLTGGIEEPNQGACVGGSSRIRATWGPWRIRGPLGVCNNILTCCFLIFVLFFSFWPTNRQVTAANMNWAVVVTVAVLAFSIAYYIMHARKVYSGPCAKI